MNSSGKVLQNIWSWVNILSLDVCAGAIAGGIMATSILGNSPGWAYWVILPAAVWLIYTVDHLIDAYRAGMKAQQRRRLVHRNRRSVLVSVVSLLLPPVAIIAFIFLPKTVIALGLCLGMMVLFYMLIVLFVGKNSAKYLPKELIVALFYTAGIWGPPLAMNTEVPETEVFILMSIFFILAFEDLMLLSYLESQQDQEEGQNSLALNIGPERTKKILNIIGISILFLAFVFLLPGNEVSRKALLILMIMQASILLILNFSKRFVKDDLYRYLSEAVFFLPALMAF